MYSVAEEVGEQFSQVAKLKRLSPSEENAVVLAPFSRSWHYGLCTAFIMRKAVHVQILVTVAALGRTV